MKPVITIALSPDVPMEFILVEGGEFLMGDDQSQFDEEKPAHRVKLSTFYISKYPVIQSQWQAVAGENPAFFKGLNRPVENVSWHEVQDYIEKLSKQTGKQFYLPTEAQWEYTARGGKYSQSYNYSGSDKLKQVAWYTENSNETHEVGLLLANELGICDMSGNVWEWCADALSEGYYQVCQQQGVIENPPGPVADSDAYRVLRGGSSFDSSLNCRVARRGAAPPSYRSDNFGFRLCFSSSVSG
jgi:formylglycine-generating enzyme required for sulfatase activity